MKKIISISDAASLALHAMAVFASEPEERFSTRSLANSLGVSGHHLSKVLQRLSRAGFVSSFRGPTGGFRISPGWETICLLDIYEVIEGPFQPANCLLPKPVCQGKCILGGLLGEINSRIRESLENTRLVDLADSFKRR